MEYPEFLARWKYFRHAFPESVVSTMKESLQRN